MAESVVYSSVMAAIFASLDVLRTRLLFFDTEIVDVTPLLVDPVEVLFASQLGGGTDINRAVAYAQEHFIEQPEKTIFLLITDLYEGGDSASLVARMRAAGRQQGQGAGAARARRRRHARATTTSSPRGSPRSARHCFGCTPKLLVRVVERMMKNQDPAGAIAEHKEGKRATRRRRSRVRRAARDRHRFGRAGEGRAASSTRAGSRTSRATSTKLFADAQGSDASYKVQAIHDDKGWRGRCSCMAARSRPFCKHAAALLVAWQRTPDASRSPTRRRRGSGDAKKKAVKTGKVDARR